MERLQKVMAYHGVASRRKCEELIRSGRVQVNGVIIKELGMKIDPKKDVITVDGKVLQQNRKVYLLLYKPSGTITSTTDPQGRRTVVDLIKDIPERIYPVGRLDFDTEGLLLLTNDGELANRILHPRYELEKEYLALVKGKPSFQAIQALRDGVELEDGLTFPAKVDVVNTNKQGNTWLKIVIHEGRNRQIRRMCAHIGHPVLFLKRTRQGFLTLDGLKPGEYRHLTKQEVARLKKKLQIN